MTGQPTPDFFGGLKRWARIGPAADKGGVARDLAQDSGMASPNESAGSSNASSSRSSGRGLPGQQGSLKENAQPWR